MSAKQVNFFSNGPSCLADLKVFVKQKHCLPSDSKIRSRTQQKSVSTFVYLECIFVCIYYLSHERVLSGACGPHGSSAQRCMRAHRLPPATALQTPVGLTARRPLLLRGQAR